MGFDILVLLVSILASAVAAISGFGVGSLLTPLLAMRMSTKLAVAAVSVPHLLATFLRFWILRSHVDRKVLVSFGLMSAAGGLGGALLHAHFGAPVLTVIFGLILIFAGLMGATGFGNKLRFGRKSTWIAGGLSGTFGGLVGNQGGIRSAALMNFDLKKEAFVATATAIGLLVDGARMPVYFFAEGFGIVKYWVWLLIASAGVICGTIVGRKLLNHINERVFRRFVCMLIFTLGVLMLLDF